MLAGALMYFLPKDRTAYVGSDPSCDVTCFWKDAVFPFRLSVSGFAGRGWLWWKLPLPIWHQNGVRKEW